MTMMLPLFLSVILLFTVLIESSQGFLGGDLPQQNSFQDTNLKIEHSSQIVKSEEAFNKYGYTGAGVNIAVVDTGVDFSNPDIMDSLARDQNKQPIMLDADGQIG